LDAGVNWYRVQRKLNCGTRIGEEWLYNMQCNVKLAFGFFAMYKVCPRGTRGKIEFVHIVKK
jgi:hypothetical protein